MMRRNKIGFAVAWLTFLAPAAAMSGICDYRPSVLLAGKGEASSGATASALGFYTLANSTTGASMLASGGTGTAASSGAAASSGGLGAVAALVTAPATMLIAAGTAVVVGGYEGACYFTDVRVTDTTEVLNVLRNLAGQADDSYFRLDENKAIPGDSALFVRNDDGNMDRYLVKDLYIVNGVLKGRTWGPNKTIGKVAFVAPKNEGGTPDAAAPDTPAPTE